MSLRRKFLHVGGSLLVVFLLVKVISNASQHPYAVIQPEEYDPSLTNKIQSVSSLLNYVDTASHIRNRHSVAYAEFLATTIRKRFYHNYSYYTFSENWASALAGEVVWTNLNAIVIPDDILTRPMAACSQQSIVLLECFRRLKMPSRAVRFARHFAAEASIGGKWYYFDTDKEPHFPNGRKSASELIKSGEFDVAYGGNAKKIDAWFGPQNAFPIYDKVNLIPAARATLFHKATKLFSMLSPGLLGGFLFYRFWVSRKKTAQVKGRGSFRWSSTEKPVEVRS